MIVYFLQAAKNKKHGIARMYSGAVRVEGRRVYIDGFRGARRNVTLLDDTHTPPLLIRYDITFRTLLNYGAKLPEFYADKGGIRRTADGALIFAAPEHSNTKDTQ